MPCYHEYRVRFNFFDQNQRKRITKLILQRSGKGILYQGRAVVRRGGRYQRFITEFPYIILLFSDFW